MPAPVHRADGRANGQVNGHVNDHVNRPAPKPEYSPPAPKLPPPTPACVFPSLFPDPWIFPDVAGSTFIARMMPAAMRDRQTARKS